MGALVRLSDVTKRYEDNENPAVASVCVDVGQGESVALMGPSGPAKLVLLALTGLVIAGGGALAPAGWAAGIRTASALRTE